MLSNYTHLYCRNWGKQYQSHLPLKLLQLWLQKRWSCAKKHLMSLGFRPRWKNLSALFLSFTAKWLWLLIFVNLDLISPLLLAKLPSCAYAKECASLLHCAFYNLLSWLTMKTMFNVYSKFLPNVWVFHRKCEFRLLPFRFLCPSSLHSRIGKTAISLLERFKIRDRISDCYFPYYAGVAMPFEPFQLCADKLTQAFTSGLSDGNFNVGIYCIMQAKYIDVFCGKNLRWVIYDWIHAPATILFQFDSTIAV